MDSEAKEPKTSEKFASLTMNSKAEGNEDQETEEEPAVEWEREADIDDDEDDEDEDEDVVVTLGFVEKPKNPRLLLRHRFPSKAGGMPAWLDPVNLPSEKSRNCGFCGEPLQFLLQTSMSNGNGNQRSHLEGISSPHPTPPHPTPPHPPRGSFANFIVLMLGCFLSVKVFRSQLPRSNPFYSSEPPKHDGTDKPSGAGGNHCFL
ncbi:hypothetical protein ACLOJK_017741 [Asimina triloba]